MITTKYFLIFLMVGVFGPQLIESIAVMSIDLGCEFMKIAIVKPGVPMEIVLNKESRRKTPLAVSMRGSDREFGEGALSQAVKSPKSAYLFITQLLAKSIDNPAVKAYREKYPYYDIRQDESTGTIYFQHDESTRYTPEEILAMILDYARDLASDFSEQSVDAAVITVPAYFNQAERKSVLQAAEIANIKVLQLMNSNVAAALNYGAFRRKDFNSTGTTIMFFDVGSTGTTATIGTFQSLKFKDDYEPNPVFTVRGVGFDRSLGGNAFSLRMATHLAKLFQEKTKKDAFSNPKAIVKLYKEADRVKNILSANSDTTSQVEGLMDDVDFKAKVTREEFEKMCADLFDRVKKPVLDAIKMAEIPVDEISSVILVGGGTRIPKVQDELMKASGKTELGKNLNTDEAPALGAVYQAAYQSKGYKVKKFTIKDANIYPIVADFEKTPPAEGSNEEPVIVRRVLFDTLNLYPQKKVLTFNRHGQDFGFNVNYGDLGFLDENSLKTMGKLNLTQVQLQGLPGVFDKHKDEESKGIKVHFRLDDSGIVEIDKIDVSFEKATKEEESTFQKIGNTISSFFGGNGDEENKDGKTSASSEPEDASKTTPAPPTQQDETKNTTASNANSTDSSTAAPKPANATANITVVRENIKFERVHVDFADWPKQKLDETRVKLSAIKEKEKEKRKRAAAINSLETFLFDLRDKLEQEDFIKCSKQEEREKVRAKLDEVDAWLSETDISVETSQFQEKLTELKNVSRDIFFRLNERKNRPKRLEELKEVLNKSIDFAETSKDLIGEDKPLTEVEWNTLDKLINSVKEWRVKMLNEQAKLGDDQDPKLLANDIHDKTEELKREVNYLVSKIKYFKPKTTKKPATSETKAPGNETNNGAEQEQKPNGEENKDQQQQQDGEEKSGGQQEEDFFNTKNDQDQGTTESPKSEDDTTTNNPEL